MAGNVSGGWNVLSRAFGGANDWNQTLPTTTGPYYAPQSDPRLKNLELSYNYGNPLLGQLAQAAAGQGPSQAQDMLREGTATNIKSQYGAAATPSVGGAAQAALLGNAQNNAAAAMQTGARQGAQLRAQEMTDARQQLSQALQGQQMVNTQAAQQELQQRLGNAQANVGIEGLNQKTGQENRGGGLGTVLSAVGSLFSDIRAKEDIQPMAPTAFASTMADENLPNSGNPFQNGIGANGVPINPNPVGAYDVPGQVPQYITPPKQDDKGGGGGFNIGGMLSSLSDERSKDHIRALEGALAESRRTAGTIGGTDVQYPTLGLGNSPPTARFPDMNPPSARFADLATPQGSRQALGPVAPYEYRYKPEFAAATGEDTSPRAGIMAQDLEQSPNPALRSAVIDTPMGKAIDGKRAVSANLALSAGLDKRLRNIEGAFARPIMYPNLAR